MAAGCDGSRENAALEREIMLQINERLFQMGIIPRDMYEQTGIKIVTGT